MDSDQLLADLLEALKTGGEREPAAFAALDPEAACFLLSLLEDVEERRDAIPPEQREQLLHLLEKTAGDRWTAIRNADPFEMPPFGFIPEDSDTPDTDDGAQGESQEG